MKTKQAPGHIKLVAKHPTLGSESMFGTPPVVIILLRAAASAPLI